MSLLAMVFIRRDGGFPRVSGDEPPGVGVTACGREFSPRERG